MTNQFGRWIYSVRIVLHLIEINLYLIYNCYVLIILVTDGLDLSPSNLSTQTVDIFIPPVKTKRKFEEGFYDEYDTGDEVTYLDK